VDNLWIMCISERIDHWTS